MLIILNSRQPARQYIPIFFLYLYISHYFRLCFKVEREGKYDPLVLLLLS